MEYFLITSILEQIVPNISDALHGLSVKNTVLTKRFRTLLLVNVAKLMLEIRYTYNNIFSRSCSINNVHKQINRQLI